MQVLFLVCPSCGLIVFIVLESPVQSGLLAQNEKTKTKTHSHIF